MPSVKGCIFYGWQRGRSGNAGGRSSIALCATWGNTWRGFKRAIREVGDGDASNEPTPARVLAYHAPLCENGKRYCWQAIWETPDGNVCQLLIALFACTSRGWLAMQTQRKARSTANVWNCLLHIDIWVLQGQSWLNASEYRILSSTMRSNIIWTAVELRLLMIHKVMQDGERKVALLFSISVGEGLIIIAVSGGLCEGQGLRAGPLFP